MEIQRLRIGAFGRLRNLDTGPEPLPGLVVVDGPNEAGKSTFFHFLTAILYGFYPASSETNPRGPWDGAEIEGEAMVRLSDGQLWEIHRRLQRTPSGSLIRNGIREDLRNRTLPCAEHVPLEVFRHVFALTLNELVGLTGESWVRVQDRLLSRMGASDLNSIRDAIQELEREAGQIWRPNRMGNQRSRDLRQRLSDLRLRRRDALEADIRLREAARDLTEVEDELLRVREEREACRLYLERYRTLLPVRERLETIAELERQAGPAAELIALPADPEVAMEELKRTLASVEQRLAEIEIEAAEPRQVVEGHDAGEERLLELREEIQSWLQRFRRARALHEGDEELERSLRDREEKAAAAAAYLLDLPWEELDPDRVLAIEVPKVREAGSRLHEILAQRRAGEEATRRRDSSRRGGAGPSVRTGGWFILAGSGGLLVGSTTGVLLISISAGIVLGIGATLLGLRALSRRPASGEPIDEEPSVPEVERLEREARADLEQALAGLPLAGRHQGDPRPDLPVSIERLQELIRDLREHTARIADRRARTSAVSNQLSELRARLPIDVPETASKAAVQLEEALLRAEEAQRLAESAQALLRPLERGAARLADQHRRVAKQEDALAKRLAGLGGGEVERGIVQARVRLDALAGARKLKEELRRAHPDLEVLRRRIDELERAADSWKLDPDTLARESAKEQELGRQIEVLARRQEGREKDLTYLGEHARVDEVDGEIAVLESELAAGLRERDRLWVVAAVLREAERRFREEHQPEILQQAGCYLAAITGGRYERILIDDAGEGQFLLRGPGYPGPVVVDDPVSTGTREQVYLSIRLAVVDHLDRNGERLPLLLDETFVNWDTARRERAFNLLGDLSATRQLFLFTCHDHMVDSLARRGARIVHLDPEADGPSEGRHPELFTSE